MKRTIFQTTLLLASLAGVARADVILLTFSGPGTGPAGTSVTLTALAENLSGVDQSLDGLTFNLDPAFTDFDESAFITFWPLSLDASGVNSQYGPAAIFDIAIPAGTLAGLYTDNSVNVYGGGGSTLLTTQSFTISVTNATPEPATLVFIGLGLIAFVGIRKRRA